MSNAYDNAVNYLYGLEKFGISFGLHKITALLKPFDNPQDKLKVIHIAGSNGKGSTAAIIESVLMSQGYSVGLYTSPHLVRFNERVRVNEEDISDEDIVNYVLRLKPYADKINLKDPVTFFDFTTALAYLYFSDKGVDFAIMETGLGGKLDSTNVIKKSVVSVITNISKEHEEFLGDNLTAIATEKAGIIKANGKVTTAEENSEVLSVFQRVANEKNASLNILQKNVEINNKNYNTFDYLSDINKFFDLRCNLLGYHQIINASLAIFSLEKIGIEINEKKLREALVKVKWEGRLEKISDNPLFFIDGAHNPSGAKVLKKTLKRIKHNKLIFVMSVMKDKDIDGFLYSLMDIADIVIFTQAKIERAADLELLRNKGEKYKKDIIVCGDIPLAIKKSVEISEEDDMICFTGSLYAVGEAKEYFGVAKGLFSLGNNYKIKR